MNRPLLHRIRWPNVGLGLLLLSALGGVAAWPALAPPGPELPPGSTVAVSPAPASPSAVAAQSAPGHDTRPSRRPAEPELRPRRRREAETNPKRPPRRRPPARRPARLAAPPARPAPAPPPAPPPATSQGEFGFERP